MEELKKLLEHGINGQLYQIICSNPRIPGKCTRIKVRPVLLKDKLVYQANSFIGNKVFHENYEKDQLIEHITEWMMSDFKQLELENQKIKGLVLVSKKGKITVKIKKNAEGGLELPDPSHNRVKKYILKEGIPVAFLQDLGVQTADGRIIRSKYDKFKQINRYLEFIEDILPILPKDRQISIIDFGCGKSYLTFALYYYLHQLKGLHIKVTGLDLKEDVIRNCNALKEQYGYENLRFLQGDISSFTQEEKIDMVVTLHACDTATDYALQKAVMWGANVILSVPCCQHEINEQIACETIQPILQYGLLKEKISALVTDGIRAQILEQMGYETQILEFIDMEHTPKNILIRAVKKRESSEPTKQLLQLMEFLHVEPSLFRLLNNKGIEDK